MISKIFHVSDVHIRTYNRHNEYKSVFDKLFKYIDENKDENSIIFLAGDIVHSKTDLSPELVFLTSEFLKRCADTLPTALILGNHDLNLNNVDRLDALTPIIQSLNHPNLYFWRDTGVYELNGVHFSIFSLLGSPEDWVLAKDIKNANYKIAAFHGPVHNSETDLKYKIQNEAVTIDRFDGFDLGLLGDIHKQQFLTERVGYSSSLIQQNMGETLDKHGLIVWDLSSSSGKFIEIENDYGYYTFEFIDGECSNTIPRLPKFLKARVKYKNTDRSVIDAYIKEISKQCTIQSITYEQMNIVAEVVKTDDSILFGIRDTERQNDLIAEYVAEKYGVTDSAIIDKLREINRHINTKIASNDHSLRNISWTAKRFEFENMFSYGEGNVIDFSNFRGVYGIFAPNAQGKSAFLDALCFCLFDKTPRTARAKHIMNINKTSFRCKFNFALNGKDYFIERIGTLKNSAVRVDTSFWCVDETGNKIDLNGKEREDTNKNIRQFIGTYDDYIMTTHSSQTDNQNFIQKTQKERKELLYNFLDMDFFDDLQKIAKEYAKETEYKIKDIDLNKTLEEISSSQAELVNLNNSIKDIQDQIDNRNRSIDLLNIQVLENTKKIIPTDLRLDIHSIDRDIANSTQAVSEATKEYQSIQALIQDINSRLENLVYEDITEKYSNAREESNRISNEISEMNKRIALLKSDVLVHKDNCNRLENHEYDPNCKYCVKNPFVKNAYKSKDLLPGIISDVELCEKTLRELETEKNRIIEALRELEIKSEQNFNFKSLQEELTKLDYRKQNCILKGKSAKESLLRSNEDKERYFQNQTTIQNNLDLERENAKLSNDIQMLSGIAKQLQSEYNSKYSRINILQQRIESLNLKYDEHTKLQQKYTLYDYYINSVSKDGVPYKILSHIIPVLEHEVNQTLSQLCDFTIRIEAGEDRNIYAYIIYSDERSWPVEMTSGMERFLISQSIRSSLTRITSLPKSNFIAIDEGFGVLDRENLNSIYLLFEYLKQQNDFIVCISHIDSMRDMVDKIISIDKIDNYSKILVEGVY